MASVLGINAVFHDPSAALGAALAVTHEMGDQPEPMTMGMPVVSIGTLEVPYATRATVEAIDILGSVTSVVC